MKQISAFGIILIHFMLNTRFNARKVAPQHGGTEEYLIDTAGCYIPNYMKTMRYNVEPKLKGRCRQRIVNVHRISENEIQFRIDQKALRKFKDRGTTYLINYMFSCAYRTIDGRLPNKPIVSDSNLFVDGTIVSLNSDIMILVVCALLPKSLKNIQTGDLKSYRDVYNIFKKKLPDRQIVNARKKWNVIMIALDSMSRGRAYKALPRVTRYFNRMKWLDYRGYQKVFDDSFPNLMAFLTGLDIQHDTTDCVTMDKCNFLWNHFKSSGYMTALGEDYIARASTFISRGGFPSIPTDHYFRSFAKSNDDEVNKNMNVSTGNYVCFGCQPAGEQLIRFAAQFAKAYKNNSFFGFFHLSTYTHHSPLLPSLVEEPLIRFFLTLRREGILNNTFVFFVGDRGLQYGNSRFSKDSYYDDRLPMLFMSVPFRFQKLHPEMYANLQLNQYRLTNHFNLHSTLKEILTLSDRDAIPFLGPPKACSTCISLFEEVYAHVTCSDVRIKEQFCACHALNDVVRGDGAPKSLALTVAEINTIVKSTRTEAGTTCITLKLKRLVRSHYYTRGKRTYYVTAGTLYPGTVGFESVVEQVGVKFRVLLVTTITSFLRRSYCVAQPENSVNSMFCVCAKILVVPSKNALPNMHTFLG